MQYLMPIVLGILSSFTASLVFLYFISRLRPKIEISESIAKRQESDGNCEYLVKIINKTPRPIINIHAQLNLMTPKVVPGGIIVPTKKIKLTKNKLIEISGFDCDDKEANYAWRFVTHEDLDSFWQDDTKSYLSFQIMAMDSFSGFWKSFTKDYHTKRNALINGDFEFGDSLEIK